MLRIAEYNKITGKKIELKELEKFGLRKNKWWCKGLYTKIICESGEGRQQFIIIIDKDRYINGYSEDFSVIGKIAYLDDTLYDLITNGYVEKVND